ncbi:MAG: hypothetical protein AB9869_09655 [Verrucomicrobiia bacterium]
MTAYVLEFDDPLTPKQTEQLRALILGIGTSSSKGRVWRVTTDLEYGALRMLLMERLGFCPLILTVHQ